MLRQRKMMTDTIVAPDAAVEGTAFIQRTVRPAAVFSISQRAEDLQPELAIGQTSVIGVGGDPGAKKTMDAKIVFFLGFLLAASGLVSPPVALVGGIAYGFRWSIRCGGRPVP